MGHKFDFSGWATRNDLRCSDGRIIRKDAFKDNDGQTVPLVWQHRHDDPTNVLGHALLENRDEGVYAYCTFNDTDVGQHAKALVEHGDVTALSIYANQLKQHGGDVLHGAIKEVSLVLAGANPGAYIDNPVLAHSDGSLEDIDDEATIYTGEGIYLAHADSEKEEPEEAEKEAKAVPTDKKEKTVKDVFDEFTDEQKQVVYFMIGQALEENGKGKATDDEEDEDEEDEKIQHADEEPEEDDDADESAPSGKKEKTVKDVFDEFTDEQKQVVYFMIGQALEDNKKEIEHSDFEGDDFMKHNVFDVESAPQGTYLTHSDEEAIIASAKKYGSFKQAVEDFAEANGLELSHADGDPAPVSGANSYATLNTNGVDLLFPEFRDVRPGAPEIVRNDEAWVKAVLGKVHKTPFSRIKTRQVDIRGIEALRAKGYLKGKEKALAGKYTVAKRSTEPQTVYVKSALNRDDVVDITDFDYVTYQYGIDRAELEKELARAILIGDGRDAADADKIDPQKIRPIWTDDGIFTIRKTLVIDATANGNNTADNFGMGYRYANAMEEAILAAKIDYRGSGAATMFTTQTTFNKMLLAKDLNGRRIYANKNELMTALDVNDMYNVPEMENQTRTAGGKTYKLVAIIGNLADYSMGATKGGEITHFTDFDIDFNQHKSLLETRCSGATTRLFSFIVIEEEVTAAAEDDGE